MRACHAAAGGGKQAAVMVLALLSLPACAVGRHLGLQSPSRQAAFGLAPSFASRAQALSAGGRGVMVRLAQQREELEEKEKVVEERPKAQKRVRYTGSDTAAARSKAQDNDTLARTLSQIVINFSEQLRPPPIENFPLLLGDISILLGFRTIEDSFLFPVQSLEIEAYPSVIEEGIGFYGDTGAALSHIGRMLVDGSALGVFWLLAVMLNGSEAVRLKATMDHSEAALITFRTWLTASVIRIVVLLMQSMALEQQIPPLLVQYELLGTLCTMLVWRTLYTAIMRFFLH